MRESQTAPGWLPERLRAWAAEHAGVLAAIYGQLVADRAWPSPVPLERQLRARGLKLNLVVTVNGMPRELGWREHSHDRVRLSLFGLACVPEARQLLEWYVATLRLALERFDDPACPDRLDRHLVQAHLGLDDDQMDLLSVLLMEPGTPFLAGGSSAPEAWDRQIDERVVAFDDATTVDAFLAELARQRLTGPPAAWSADLHLAAPATADRPDSSSGGRRGGVVAGVVVALAVLAGAADVIGVLSSSGPIAAAVIAAAVVAAALHLRLSRGIGDPRAIAAIAAAALAAAAGWMLLIDGDDPAQRGTQPTAQHQLDAVLRQAGREGRNVAWRTAAPLHGDGSQASTVVVLRDERLVNHPRGDIPTDDRGRFVVPTSDELRVYDVRNNRLTLAFRFMPQNPGQIVQRPDRDMPGFRFKPRSVSDIDGDGRVELIGAWERVTLASGPTPVPVIVAWDSDDGAYRISPLIDKRPDLQVRSPPGPVALEYFTVPTVLRDRFTDRRLRGYGVDEYTVIDDRPEAVLAAGYFDVLATSSPRLELKVWSVDLQSGAPQTLECLADMGRRHSFVRVPATDDFDAAAALRTAARRRADPPCSL